MASAPRRYASAPMLERRRRILAEAQQLLDEHGVEGFTIRELSSRASVAQRTLYNLFGSKEELIAAAIEQHFDGLLAPTADRPPPIDLESVLARARAIADYVVTLKRYASAMTGVYFSPAADRRIHDSLVRISEAGNGHWLDHAEAAGVLVRMTAGQRAALGAVIANGGYANVSDWASGRIDDETLRRRAQANLLLASFAFLAPRHRETARRLLDDLLL